MAAYQLPRQRTRCTRTTSAVGHWVLLPADAATTRSAITVDGCRRARAARRRASWTCRHDLGARRLVRGIGRRGLRGRDEVRAVAENGAAFAIACAHVRRARARHDSRGPPPRAARASSRRTLARPRRHAPSAVEPVRGARAVCSASCRRRSPSRHVPIGRYAARSSASATTSGAQAGLPLARIATTRCDELRRVRCRRRAIGDRGPGAPRRRGRQRRTNATLTSTFRRRTANPDHLPGFYDRSPATTAIRRGTRRELRPCASSSSGDARTSSRIDRASSAARPPPLRDARRSVARSRSLRTGGRSSGPSWIAQGHGRLPIRRRPRDRRHDGSGERRGGLAGASR